VLAQDMEGLSRGGSVAQDRPLLIIPTHEPDKHEAVACLY
jgi:hypothetical protein